MGYEEKVEIDWDNKDFVIKTQGKNQLLDHKQ